MKITERSYSLKKIRLDLFRVNPKVIVQIYKKKHRPPAHIKLDKELEPALSSTCILKFAGSG
jgi:hypothetical protein